MLPRSVLLASFLCCLCGWGQTAPVLSALQLDENTDPDATWVLVCKELSQRFICKVEAVIDPAAIEEGAI